MAKWLRACTAFEKDQGVVSSTHAERFLTQAPGPSPLALNFPNAGTL